MNVNVIKITISYMETRALVTRVKSVRSKILVGRI